MFVAGDLSVLRHKDRLPEQYRLGFYFTSALARMAKTWSLTSINNGNLKDSLFSGINFQTKNKNYIDTQQILLTGRAISKFHICYCFLKSAN